MGNSRLLSSGPFTLKPVYEDNGICKKGIFYTPPTPVDGPLLEDAWGGN
jgi:hypothetical protein